MKAEDEMLLGRHFMGGRRGLDLDAAHVIIPSENKVVLMSYMSHCAFEGSIRR